MSRPQRKHGDTTIPVPDDQVVIYQTCECCQQSMPLDQFDRRGRWRPGQPPADTMCKHCREIKERETKKYVRRNAQAIDKMQLDLVKALAEEPTDDFSDEIPNIGTMVQHLLRPFGGMKGLSLQVASSYLSSPPGSPNRQRIQSMLMKLGTEASRQGYAKKPIEMLSDEELALHMKELQRRTLKLADGNDEEEEKGEDVGA